MEGLTLEELPLEVVEAISGYLSVQELSACCATSHTMRDLFGCDAVWRQHCDKDLVDYLSSTACKVQPPFVSPKLKDSTLRPVSHWRMAFFRENHLWNNWRQGKQTQEEIKNQRSDGSNYNALCHVFQTSDVIIALFRDRFELLDVREFPAAFATEPVRFGSSFSYSLQVNAGNNMVVILHNSGVLVYPFDLSSKQCSLQHLFFFDDSQKLNVKSPSEVGKAFDARKSQPSFKALRVVEGNFFVGILEGDSVLHIWNLETGLKLKEEACPIKGSIVVDIKASDTMNIILSIKQKGQNSYTLLAYSLTKLAYLPFRETFDCAVQYSILHDTVGVYAKRLLHIYNYKNSELLLKDQPADSFAQILKNNFVFVQDGVMKIFNATSKNVLSLQLNDVVWFEALSNRLVQVQRGSGFELWEYNGSRKSLKKNSMALPFRACGFFLNKASTRYIVLYSVGEVIHFW